MDSVLEVYHGSDGRVRWALVKTEDENSKDRIETGTPVLRKCFSGEFIFININSPEKHFRKTGVPVSIRSFEFSIFRFHQRPSHSSIASIIDFQHATHLVVCSFQILIHKSLIASCLTSAPDYICICFRYSSPISISPSVRIKWSC